MEVTKPFIQHRMLWLVALGLILIAYIAGLFIPVLEVDAAQYASISREMMETGQYLQVHHRYADYLDKPPLLFWLSAISMELFGVSIWAYKLPSFLFSLLAFYAVYRLGKLLYDKRTGLLAVLVLSTTQAYFLFNQDVRTDTLLTACVALAIWLLQEYRQSHKLEYLFAGAVAVGLAMLAKGPIGLMVPTLAIGSDVLWRREWRTLLHWKWLLALPIIALVLAPMLYGLYMQFDLHPEKTVNGVQGQSGLKFFFWTQSFGRLTGENVWKNDDSPSAFFLHTILWSFLPWALALIGAVLHKVRAILRKDAFRQPVAEVLTLGGLVLPLIAFSFSHYKLPHYIFVSFPLAAILTAHYLLGLSIKAQRFWVLVQAVLVVLYWIGLAILAGYSFPVSDSWLPLFLGIVLVATLYIYIRGRNITRLILPTLFSAAAFNFAANAYLYPKLMQYQSSIAAADYLDTNEVPKRQVAKYGSGSHAFDFYRDTVQAFYYHPVQLDSALNAQGRLYIFTDEAHLEEVKATGRVVEIVSFPEYSVQLLSLPFLQPDKRRTMLRKSYLVHLQNQ